jgi:hypothetical protein
MELEGFGASLVGRVLYVYADAASAWIPWEFVSGTAYSCRLLISGDGPGLRCVEAENSWTAVFRPTCAKDWSCIATVIRGMSPSVLLVFDTHAPPAPPAFISFMDSVVADGRTILTRIWIGQHIEIPAIPDAIFVPALHETEPRKSQEIYELFGRLPGRGSHGGWSGMNGNDWNALVKATGDSDLGMVFSDIGEHGWTLFWHKIGDSRAEGHGVMIKRGFTWLRTGMALVEKHQGAVA